jgi:hypothetical protein
MNPKTAFQKLSTLTWSALLRTYGNAHSSYIGFFVNWWLSLSPDHAVLDPGPSYALRIKRGTNASRGHCDSVFCVNDTPVGILEIEGLRPRHVIEKVGRHFESPRVEFAPLSFGIICLYSTRPRGRGPTRRFPPALPPELLADAKQLSQRFPDKGVILIDLDKRYQHIKSGARALSKNEYYCFQVSRIHRRLLLGGHEVDNAEFPNAVQPGVDDPRFLGRETSGGKGTA